jgi:hypothetical protein
MFAVAASMDATAAMTTATQAAPTTKRVGVRRGIPSIGA